MSCNGCRVLRKGCSVNCILRPCLQWIDAPESQGHATVFVAKFFGRAGLMSFISNVPLNQRPALFQSLLYEACGRTISPVSGSVGLLWTGNWPLCQAAVDTILRGGTLRPIPELLAGAPPSLPTGFETDESSEVACPMVMNRDLHSNSQSPQPRFTNSKRRREKLDLSLTSAQAFQRWLSEDKQRPDSPSLSSEESATTISFENGPGHNVTGLLFPERVTDRDTRLLNLFV